MSEMIERVAGAMTHWLDAFWRMEDGSIQAWVVRDAASHVVASFPPSEYREAAHCCDEMNARAAIAAMLEPTEAMIQAGFEQTGDPCWPENVAKAWKAMVLEMMK